jgi:hypothetical protein
MAMGILLMRGIKRLAIVLIGAMATYLRDRRHGAQPVSGRRGSAARDGLALERPRRVVFAAAIRRGGRPAARSARV